MAQVAKMIVFSGRVQGVGFRYTVHRTALQYELTGYVKNLPNGCVEMFAQGTPEDIDNCLVDIQRHFEGYITHVAVEDTPLNTTYDRFIITF